MVGSVAVVWELWGDMNCSSIVGIVGDWKFSSSVGIVVWNSKCISSVGIVGWN